MLDNFIGCMRGVAIGDALGAPVEGLSSKDIMVKFGVGGIHSYDIRYGWGNTRGFIAGSITDDTQMTLATAAGIIFANENNINIIEVIHQYYIQWLLSQSNSYYRRGPGKACLTALASGGIGTIDKPINDSKGCGALMRVTPVGLAYHPQKAFKLGCKVGALTHGHPNGYLASGFFAEFISRLVNGESICNAIDSSLTNIIALGNTDIPAKILLATELSSSNKSDREVFLELGLGFIAEETLAIALYSVLKHIDSFDLSVITSVNHDGDSDSTGAVTGAISGLLNGNKKINQKWSGVELENELTVYGEKLYNIRYGVS